MLSGKNVILKPQRRYIRKQRPKGSLESRNAFTTGYKRTSLLCAGNSVPRGKFMKEPGRIKAKLYLGRWIQRSVTKNLMWSTMHNFSSQSTYIFLMEKGTAHRHTIQ